MAFADTSPSPLSWSRTKSLKESCFMPGTLSNLCELEPSGPPGLEGLFYSGRLVSCKPRVLLQVIEGLFSRLFKEREVGERPGYPEVREPGLAGAYKVPGAPHLSIPLGHPVAVPGRFHDPVR